MKYISVFFLLVMLASCQVNKDKVDLSKLKSPIIFKGDDNTAYRDPAILYHDGRFYLYFTLSRVENDSVFQYTAQSRSRDLVNWTPYEIITPRDQNLDFCSPGNVIKFNNEWIMCLQTYPRPNYTVDQMPRFGNNDARLYTMTSKDLETWSHPELLRVKGNDVSVEKMGRMIDAYFVEDKNESGKWWCFYKQNGVSMSYSYNLRDWTFFGYTESGENACVLTENDEYILLHSLKNGMGIKKSEDLVYWEDFGPLITLGQQDWEWAKGRISAGAILDLRKVDGVNKYLMFFHGSGPLTEEEGDFDKNSSLGIAWSDDLTNWEWPGK